MSREKRINPTYRQLYREYISTRTTYIDGQTFGYPADEQAARWERLKELDRALSAIEMGEDNPSRFKYTCTIIGIFVLVVVLALVARILS